MKKNRLLITISDTNGSKSFNVNKIIKKILIWVLFSVVVIFSLSFFTISNLTNSVNELSKDRKLLLKANNTYTEEIELKKKQINALGLELEEIESIIGMDKEDDTSLIQRATLAKLTLSEKIFMLQTIPSECPLPVCTPTSKFGWRIHPITKKKKWHNGLDLRAARKTEVKSTADGVVRYVQNKNDGNLGRTVIILHNYGFETVYGHLRYVNVKAGDVISKGQLIAKSGNSGRSSGPHLHYEVRYGGKILNPTSFTKWNMKNYEKIFDKQRRVQWESLVKLIKKQQKKLVQQ